MSLHSPTLEGLPYNLQIKIIYSITSFCDLYKLTTASPDFRRIFKVYPRECLTNISRNILGDSWEDATTVLVWQRHGGIAPDLARVEEALKKKKFRLHQKDVPQIVANQRFFNSCAVLPMRLFYQMWLLHLRFGHERLRVFARRRPVPEQKILDMIQLSRLVAASPYFKKMIGQPSWKRAAPLNQDDLQNHMEIFPAVAGLFTLFSCTCCVCQSHRGRIVRGNDEKNNPLLKLKITSHLAAAIGSRSSQPQHQQNIATCVIIREYYPVATVRALVKGYDLDNWMV